MDRTGIDVSAVVVEGLGSVRGGGRKVVCGITSCRGEMLPSSRIGCSCRGWERGGHRILWRSASRRGNGDRGRKGAVTVRRRGVGVMGAATGGECSGFDGGAGRVLGQEGSRGRERPVGGLPEWQRVERMDERASNV